MGNYYSTEFTIYGRSTETNKYVIIEESVEGNPMSRFKHETYAFALKKKHHGMKALYLYCGYNRMCKVSTEMEQEVPYCTIAFSTADAGLQWDACQEQIPKVHVDLAWLERTFASHYVELQCSDVFQRRYQNYKMDMKK